MSLLETDQGRLFLSLERMDNYTNLNLNSHKLALI